MRFSRSLAALLVALAVGVLVGRSELSPSDDSSFGGDAGRVLRVVDGDTIQVRIGQVRERVRYIGVDTPETRKPGAPVECYGRAASARNERLVRDEQVRLVLDAEPRDRYGRLLAYVYRVSDGRFINADLVRGGFAEPLAIPPNVRYAERFAALAGEARRSNRGLWRACR